MKQLLFLGVAAVLAAFLAAGGLTGSSGTVHADPFNSVFTYKTTWSTLAPASAPNLDVQVGIDCPLGSGACPVEELLRAGAPVGLGVDGAASNEDASLPGEVRQALLLARVRAALLGRDEPARALDAATAWSLASRGGAACLGRDDCGALEEGRCADVAAYRLDDLLHAGIEDPLEALALAPPLAGTTTTPSTACSASTRATAAARASPALATSA